MLRDAATNSAEALMERSWNTRHGLNANLKTPGESQVYDIALRPVMR